MSTRLVALLFLDLQGWSRSTDTDWDNYVRRVLPLVKRVSSRFKPLMSNTWGDAIFLVFDSSGQGAACALEIRDLFRKTSPIGGLSQRLVPRISLHVGEVHKLRNPFLARSDYFGEAVHTAARIEPIVAPGSVFCTVAFKSHCETLADSPIGFHSVGERHLAKGYGKQVLFGVLWARERPSTPSGKEGDLTARPVYAGARATRDHLMSASVRRCAALRALGVHIAKPRSSLSDQELLRYGMMPVPPFPIHADPFPVSETDFADFCKVTNQPLPPYLSNRKPRDSYPVVFVSAFDADAYAAWLGKRLPTLEEWEAMAFRQPDERLSPFPWGMRFSVDKCNSYESRKGRITPFTAYPLGRTFSGAYDAVGNAWEWLSESTENGRLVIGGSFYDAPKYCARGQSITWDPAESVLDIGFRCFVGSAPR